MQIEAEVSNENENQRMDEVEDKRGDEHQPFSPKRQLPSKFKINRTSRKSNNNANACSQPDLKTITNNKIDATKGKPSTIYNHHLPEE